MRRWMMLAIVLSIGAPVVLPHGLASARAQPFGFLFGAEPRAYRQRSSRAHARPRRPEADIPLPVPRPHFAQDPAAGPIVKQEVPPVVAPPTGTRNALPKDMPAPRDTPAKEMPAQNTPGQDVAPKETAVTPPAPPAKPVDLGGASSAPAPSPPPAAKAANPLPSPPPETKGDSAPPLTVPVTGPLTPPLPPSKPADVGPANTKPDIAASGATTATSPRQPDEDSLCPGRLKAQAVLAEPIIIGPQPDERCTIVQAVKLTGLTLPDGGTIEFPDRPVIACTTAESFSAYVRDLLSPLAKGTFGARIDAVWTGPGLECRSRDHVLGAKLSAHGQGLAVDVAQLKLTDGRAIAVGEPKTPQDNAFETAARAGGCGYFHTVLGPGSDSYHRTHWHFDLEVRGAKGDTKYCH